MSVQYESSNDLHISKFFYLQSTHFCIEISSSDLSKVNRENRRSLFIIMQNLQKEQSIRVTQMFQLERSGFTEVFISFF